MKSLGEYYFSYCLTLCCYNQIPETRSFIKNRNVFLTVPQVGKNKVKGPRSGEGLVAVIAWWKGRRASWREKMELTAPSPSLSHINPFMRMGPS